MVLKVATSTLTESQHDLRDYIVGNVVKNIPEDIPESFKREIKSTYYQNGRGSCTAMASTHSMKIQNEYEYPDKEIELDWKDLWTKMGHNLADKSDSGDSIENSVSTVTSKGIEGRRFGKLYIYQSDLRAYGKWPLRKATCTLSPLSTVIYGNANTRNEMLDGELKTIVKRSAKSQGHNILIVGYDKLWVYFVNSFGDSINKGGVSQFKMSIVNFNKAIASGMVNWRYFVLLDKKDAVDYFKQIELSKQVIKPLKSLYEIGDQETKDKLEERGVTSRLETKYGFKY